MTSDEQFFSQECHKMFRIGAKIRFGLFYGPWTHFRSFQAWSITLPNHTVPGQASKAVYQYLVHIL